MTFKYAYFRSEAELRAGVLIWQYVSPILIIFGTVGNVLSIIILSRQLKSNRLASTVYLLGLAVADTCMLYVGLVRNWVKYVFDVDFRFVHPVVCKIHWWLMYVCADISVWILTIITVERLIAALCPYKSKRICTKNRAVMVLLSIVLTALIINSHLLYGFGKVEISNDNHTTVFPCAPLDDSYAYFFGKIWTWIDLCKFCLVPFAVLSTGNICIISKLVNSRKKVRNQVAPSTTISEAPCGGDRNSNMSVLLICLNFVFITCTLPICIYFIGEPYWIPKEVPRNVQLQDPWWAVVNMLMYTNNTVNFILYCLTGSRFRNCVKELFVCKEKNQSTTTTNSITRNSRFGRTDGFK